MKNVNSLKGRNDFINRKLETWIK